jgi:hypothetical protein
MVVDNFAIVAVFDIGEAVACRDRLGFAVFRVRERVVAGVDRSISVHADQLIAELDGGLR